MPAKPAGKGRRLRLGRYELSSPVKTWDQGAVYRAIDGVGQEVAVKLLSGDVIDNAASLKKLQQEVAQASRCKHDNILRVHEMGEANGTWFLATELVEGTFLGKHIAERGPFGQAKALRWLGQMAKAVDHAHKQGLSPDSSPGGFLVTGDGKLKLVPPFLSKGLDKGFAEIDLSAPEQKAGPPDIRAVFYTLGGTLHLILTGEPPKEPLDLEVSDHLLTITEKLLASDPDDRYQKPSELLADMDIPVEESPSAAADEVPADEEPKPDSEPVEDEVIDDDEPQTSWLEEIESGAKVERPSKPKPPKSSKSSEPRLQPDTAIRADEPPLLPEEDLDALADDGDEILDEEKPKSRAKAKSQRDEPKEEKLKEEDQAPEDKPNEKKPKRDKSNRPSPTLVGGLLAAILVAGGVAIFLATREEAKDPSPQPGTQGKLPLKVDPNPKQENQLAPLDIPALKQEFEGPWATPMAVSKDAKVFRVSRMPPPEGTKPGTYFNSLAAACAAAPEKVTTIIEIHDNGPLFELPITISDRSVMIREGLGYQPMLIWDLTRWKAKDAPANAIASFLSVERGELWLGNLEMALDWPADAPGPASLVRLHNSELVAWDCTFSCNGLSGLPVSIVRFETDQPGKRCRLSNCFARGPNLIALDLKALAPEVMLDQCLVVGKDLPLVRSLSSPAADKLPTVRLIRSTLVGERGIVQVRPSGPDPKLTGLRFMCWDALLARAAKEPGGVLLELPKNAEPANYQWRSINSLYAGWNPLLDGPEKIDDFEAWKKRWSSLAGWELAKTRTWAELTKLNLLRSLGAHYAPVKDLQILATFVYDPKELGKELFGCDVNRLRWSRGNWLELGYLGFKIPAIEVLKDGRPAIPVGKEVKGVKDEKYYGGKVDLNKTDIIQHLQEVQKKQELGDTIVLHLSGSGTKKMRPLLQRNRSFVLYFEPPEKGKEPLVLVPEADEGTFPGALFQLVGGSLEIIGGDIRFPDVKASKSAKVPHYLIHVWAGNLRIHGTRLQGPLGQPPDSYWGLIRLEGYGSADPKLIFGCTIHESVLVSPRVGMHVSGIGARLRLEQSLIVTGGDALHFQPGANPPPSLNLQCTLVNNTIAARQSAVYVQDMPSWRLVGDPIVVESKANVFMNPYLARDKKGPAPATMVLYQGTALPRGVLAWQGRGDVFDNRLEAFALPAASDGLPPRKFARQKLDGTWRDLWGAFGSRGAILDRDFNTTIDLEQPSLDQLAYPNPNVPLGADFKKLKIKN